MRNIFRSLVLAFLLACGIVALAQPALGCPGCKEGIASEAEDDQAVVNPGIGYSYSVLFMLGMLFLTATGFGTACYWSCVKHRWLGSATKLAVPPTPTRNDPDPMPGLS